MWIFYAFQVISDLFKYIITTLFRITKLPSKLLWGNILPSKPAHYNGTTVDAVLFFKQRFLSIRWGVGSGLSRVIYRILMVRIEGTKKIQKVLKSKVLKYLIDSKINISLSYPFLYFFETATLYLPWPMNYSKLIKFSRRKGKGTKKKNFTLLMKLLILKYWFNLSTPTKNSIKH